MSDQATDWLEVEATAGALRTELRRLKRRAKQRKLLVIMLALVGAGAVLFKMSRRVPLYQASVVIRATEGVLVKEESPLATQGLANYLYGVALSTERLLPIIEEHNLYPSRATFGDLYAVDELRNFLDIEIGSNFFAKERDEGDPQRSVGITLHFSNFDPQLAFDVAQDLSVALMEAEGERRRASAEKLSAIADSTVRLVKERLAKQSAELASADAILRGAATASRVTLAVAQARVTKKRLLQDIKQTSLLLETTTAQQSYTNLARAAEGANQALQFEIIDVRRPLIVPATSWVIYAIIGLFVFLCLLPLCAIGLAAWDSKLHHIDDVMRLGMPVVGHLPAFPGAQMGTLEERRKKAKQS